MSVTVPPSAAAPAPPAKPERSPVAVAVRFAVSGVLLAGYFVLHAQIIEIFTKVIEALAGFAPALATPKVFAVTVLGLLLVATWWKLIKRDVRFQAPILITHILAVGDATYGIL